jgi:hypothetical protein
VSQDAFGSTVAVQLPPMQPVGKPVIETFCDPEFMLGDTDVGEIEKLVQEESEMSFCWTVKVLPATVAVPVRVEVPVCVPHETTTVPLPAPLEGETLSQESFAAALQPAPPEQPEGAPITLTFWEPDVLRGFTEVGLMV